VRLLPDERGHVEVRQKIKRAPLSFEEILVQKRFRRYVQVFEGSKTFFKEFGDPRVMSSATGRYYRDEAALVAEESEGDGSPPPRPATEVIHFSVRSPRTPYGIPRWIGNLLAVLGSRQAEEVNFLYFENKSVPPLACLVSGGRLSASSTERLETFIENRIKGRANFHKILVIEGEQSATSLDNAGARMRIELVPLTMAQHSDALFQVYDERNIDKVGMAFRLPRLLRGDIRDFNRATAEAALEFAETQVFAPERQAFDWLMNRLILSELGVKFWEFRSNAPTTRNPIDLAEIISKLVVNGILTPEEARDLAKGIFNRDLKKIDEIWTRIPPGLVRAGITSKAGLDLVLQTLTVSDVAELDVDDEDDDPNVPPAPGAGDQNEPPPGAPGIEKRFRPLRARSGIRKLARDLVELRAVLDDELRERGASRIDEDRTERLESETIVLSAEEFADLVGRG
jgi:PBSX family phage portal protein